MSLENAFETGRLYKPLQDIADSQVSETLSTFQMLPMLRGFWPMSSVNPSGRPMDFSEFDLKLTNNGTSLFNYTTNGIPWASFNGTDQYLSYADDSLLDIRGNEEYVNSAIRGLTIGGWFWDNNVSVIGPLIAKYDTGSNQRSYYLVRAISNGAVHFIVSGDGSTGSTVIGLPGINQSSWFFAVGRYIPSVSITSFVSGNFTHLTTGIPATLFNSNAEFNIAKRTSGSDYLAGRATMCFVCAAALSDLVIDNLYQTSRRLFEV